MTELKFTEIINSLQDQVERQDKLYELGIDDREFNCNLWFAVDHLFIEAFGEMAATDIAWWMYDSNFGKRTHLIENSDLKTVSDLYNCVINRKK